MVHWLINSIFQTLILETKTVVYANSIFLRFLTRLTTCVDNPLPAGFDSGWSTLIVLKQPIRLVCDHRTHSLSTRSVRKKSIELSATQSSSGLVLRGKIGNRWQSILGKRHFSSDSENLELDPESTLQTNESISLEEICEEGFSLNYTTPLQTEAKLGILDYIRASKMKRGPRLWMHRLPSVEDEVVFEDLDESQTNKEASYRSDHQTKLLGVNQRAVPPWVRPVYLPDTRFVDHDDYISIDGGKLGNKISDHELTVDQLRVDTRVSIKSSKIDKDQLLDLDRLKKIDGQLRELCGVEYEKAILLTVGAQGSGKSKFALDLVEHGSVPWVRVNQDTIRNGRRGTRVDCVNKTKDMIARGYCVVIDRMNFVPEQRDEFINLSNELRVPIHAIVFRLPFVENVYNVASREDHEGNFEGTSDIHRQIIYATRERLFDKGHPKNNNEGFSSVFECQSNDDYAFAFRQWMNYGRKTSIDDRSTSFRYQQPWRIHDVSKLREMAELIEQDGMLGKNFPIPLIVTDPDALGSQPVVNKETIGYWPSRDGPVSRSDEEKDE
eukprot:g4105.t1